MGGVSPSCGDLCGSSHAAASSPPSGDCSGWNGVGANVGRVDGTGEPTGRGVGDASGRGVGRGVGRGELGRGVGSPLGRKLGSALGRDDGSNVGSDDGRNDGSNDGACVGAPPVGAIHTKFIHSRLKQQLTAPRKFRRSALCPLAGRR